MAPRKFDTPVRVVNGSGQTCEIASPYEAYTFLAGRKLGRFGVSDALLRRLCSGASMGLVKPAAARAAFVKYAQKHGIIAPEAEMAAAPPEASGMPLPA